MVRAHAELEHGRDSYTRRRWRDAYESLAAADRAAPLRAADLELLARSAHMLGRDDDYVRGLERAHHAHQDAGDAARAVPCAWWIGHNLLFRGEANPAQGWFACAEAARARTGRLRRVAEGPLGLPASSAVRA